MGRWNAAFGMLMRIADAFRRDKARLLTKGDNNVADDTEL